MDYFQGVVTEFLRADRAMFVNTECLLQLDLGAVPAKGRHWFCDAVAVNFRESAIYLCEVTYSSTVQSLVKRLRAWDSCWPLLCAAITRASLVPSAWRVQPWLFIPQDRHATLTKKLAALTAAPGKTQRMPAPKVTFLESVTPWRYRTWDRRPSKTDDDA